MAAMPKYGLLGRQHVVAAPLRLWPQGKRRGETEPVAGEVNLGLPCGSMAFEASDAS